ncbi:capsule assembly Wzi family protein [Acinetobacter baumannii 24812_8]|nr:capsule assembly Wzi family protein [Acinetobacter baumannii 24812_8]
MQICDKKINVYVGEDEAGLLPSKKMYLAGVDYSSSYNNMPYQLYAEWADTRTASH